MSFNNWKKYKIGEIVDFHNTKRVALNSREREIRKGNYPYYGASGIVDHLSDYTFDGEYVLISEDGENLRTRKTPIVFIINGKFRVNNHAHIVQGKQDFINKWLVYFFQNFDINPFITGAVQPKLNKENLQLIEIPIPEINTAKKIISILSSLDDKIELNCQTNQTLETIAQTLFKEMCLPKSEVLPDGWKVEKLVDIVEIKYGKDHKHLEEGKIPVYGSGGIMRFVNKALYENESILIPRKGTLSNLFYINKPFWSVDTMFYTKIENKTHVKFLFLFLKTLNLASMNVGSAVPSLTTEVLNKIEIILPPTEVLKKFNDLVTPFFQTLDSNNEENHTLIALRNSLLPKLMRGEIAL